MPRILVIMDEFQILFNDSSNRKVAMNCAELTKAYSLNCIDIPLLQTEIQKWNQFQLAVEKEFLCPEKSDPFGNK